MAGKKKTVEEIVVERLVQRINEEGRLPWQKPFHAATMNWYSEREYRGINKILLVGGEYITVKQLQEYNKKKKTNFWFEAGTPYEIAVFYTRSERRISQKEADRIIQAGYGHKVKQTPTGYVSESFILRYYRVYNINYIKDKEGNKLEPKLGKTLHETFTPADDIINFYTKESGVMVDHTSQDGAYYTHLFDKVVVPQPKYFASSEAYYRVVFHELIHSTGVEKRLNRPCFKQYHEAKVERSKEELIAEIGGLLLASEAGFSDDSQWADNSINYVANWCAWMKENPKEVLSGLSGAEKAKNYITSGGKDTSEFTDVSINNPEKDDSLDGISEESNIVTEGEPGDNSPTTENEKKDSVIDIKSIKSKKAVSEFYVTKLSKYFSPNVTAEERKDILDSVKLADLKYLYYTLKKEKISANKKVDVLMALRELLEGVMVGV